MYLEVISFVVVVTRTILIMIMEINEERIRFAVNKEVGEDFDEMTIERLGREDNKERLKRKNQSKYEKIDHCHLIQPSLERKVRQLQER